MTFEENTYESGRWLKTKLVVVAICLLILALSFNALLSSSSLEKLYIESLVSSYQVIGKDFQRNLEKALRYGKSIKKFVGINALMNSTLRYITREGRKNIKNSFDKSPSATYSQYIAVALPDGEILYCTNQKLVGTALTEKARMDYGKKEEKEKKSKKGFVKVRDTYFVSLPIHDRMKQWIASMVLTFDEKQVQALMNAVILQDVKIGLAALGGSILFLIIVLHFILPKNKKLKKFPRRKISFVLFFTIIVSQAVFSFYSTNAFKDYYLRINKEKTFTFNALLKEDIEYLLSKGLPIKRLFKMEVMLGEKLGAMPEANEIILLDHKEMPLYMANKQGSINFTKKAQSPSSLYRVRPADQDDEYSMRLNILKDKKTEGYILTQLSKEVVWAKLREVILDALTVLIISILFSVELLILIFQFIGKKELSKLLEKTIETDGSKNGFEEKEDPEVRIRYGTIRPAAFLFLFGIDVSISFVPLHMEKLYKPLFGLSKEMIIGLPISCEMFFAGISILLAGAWVDRRGWHQPFFLGLFIAGLGVLYSWMAPDAVQFVISRGVVGIGYGLALMAAQGFSIAYTDEQNRAQGLTQLFAGVYAGSICGGAAGAMMAERIGYNPVFLIGAVILFMVILYTVFFMKDAIRHPSVSTRTRTAQKVSMRQVFKFIANRNIIALAIFSIFPGALALVGFINFFSPVYLNRIGESQSNIGRIYMIYGVCLIYLAPYISTFVDASRNKKAFIVLSGIFGCMGFILFFYSSGLISVAVAILLLGLCSCFGFAAQNAFALELKVTSELGEGKAVGLLSSAERVGQVFGPLVFGWLMVAIGVKQGITYFGIAFFIATLIFMLLAKNERGMVPEHVSS
jgi:predicted MFS family arabinose efflux permease